MFLKGENILAEGETAMPRMAQFCPGQNCRAQLKSTAGRISGVSTPAGDNANA